LYEKRIVSTLSLIVLISLLLVVTPQPANSAKFILAGWDYPDEYGQGIRNVAMEQYTNGEWVALTAPSPPKGYYYSSSVFNITDGEGSNGSILIGVQSYLNATLCGISDINDGPALIRHTITVSTAQNSSVFYQENFTLTYQTDAYAPMYFYQYEVVTDFTPLEFMIYTAIITYEIFYAGE